MGAQWLVTLGLALFGVSQGVDAEPADGQGQIQLCVDTIDCGGICGNRGEVNAFLAQCQSGGAGNGPVGPCFSNCWNACLHATSQGNNPTLQACTLQCTFLSCPGDAAAVGLVHAGLAECPPPDPATTCFAVYDPIECAGSCVYSNACVASGAGFNPASCDELGGPIITLP